MKNQTSGTSSSGLLAALTNALLLQRAARSSSKLKPAIPANQLPRHMHHNRAEIESAALCGCISCEQMFQKNEISVWVAAGANAVCPRYDATTVVGLGAGFQLTPGLLYRAHSLLFEGTEPPERPRSPAASFAAVAA